MKELINSIKDFKIIPNNFKSAAAFELIKADDDFIEAKLIQTEDNELDDYYPDTQVEVFGVNDVGLVYFETKITSKDKNIIKLATTPDYSIIQRREYSRVDLKQGSVIFKDMSDDFILHIEDISAGGIKFVASNSLENDKEYDITIILSNNMKINCSMKPTRIKQAAYNNKDAYIISGKFTNLENVDRIVLVQYAFRIKMEEQNKENS